MRIQPMAAPAPEWRRTPLAAERALSLGSRDSMGGLSMIYNSAINHERDTGVSMATLILRFCLLLLLSGAPAWAQVDQGTITGTVQDSTGAIIPGANVTLTDTDTGLVLTTKANGSGIYVFSPLKIGNYKVSASAPEFQTTTRENLHLDIQERLNIPLRLQPGSVKQTVTVSGAPPLLQTEQSSIGQVISTQTINDTPLNGRNWVYIAQLTAGVAPPFDNTRGSGTGDFVANGQNAEQNNFILDGVDNNTNLVDFLNGSSFVIRPPPDALSEFNLQTSNYSAEFGHSAGAVMNASIKSGTNHIHGDVWEYWRNTDLDARNWNALSVPPYHENQFGATLGLPIFKNRLFYFGDTEANRISIGQTNVLTVPTPLMRQGNFSELLNPALTGAAQATQLYQPNSGGAVPLSCNGQNNVFCSNQIDAVASGILNLYPQPNSNGGKTYNNLVENVAQDNDTFQWDQRLDWNISRKDQSYARYSYVHQIIVNALPLGPILDGSGYGGQRDTNLAENFMLSETHIFAPTLTNEFRFGYNWGVFKFLQPNADNPTVAASLGLGGVPELGPGKDGLPLGYFNGVIQQWGSVGTSDESQNVYQILDNVTKILGNHSLKFGVAFQSIRFLDLYAPASLGQYKYNPVYTGAPGVSFTGSAVADFLANQMNTSYIANAPPVNDAEWYNSAYAQDDWRVTNRLTVNLGVRYDYFQPYKENAGEQANFIATGPLGIATGSGIYELPASMQNKVNFGAPFLSTLAKDNVTIQYVGNERLATAKKTDFAPRIGFAFQSDPKTVFRGGFGLFYGGLQSQGSTNLGENFPFSLSASVPAPNCFVNNCPSLGSQGVTLEAGLSAKTANGLQNFVLDPGFSAIDPNIKTPYTMSYSFATEHAWMNNLTSTISYVGNVARHLSLYYAPNTVTGLFNPSISTQLYQPFPDLGGIGTIHFVGVSTYNSLQAKMEKRYSSGLSFLATYTWAHAMDDASDAGGLSTAVTDRNMALIPFIDEYTNSPYDIRHRFTFNGNYQLPFGRGKTWLNHSEVEDLAVGGWSSSLTFAAQTGTPFTVSPNISTAAGGSANAILIRDPYAPGGTADPSNSSVTCATQTKTKTNWYNPCAFANPLPGNLIAPPGVAPGSNNSYRYASPVTGTASAIAFLGGRQYVLYGPGYYAVNMSLFKNFTTWREQYLQFRADAFNLLNHPTWANPSTTNDNTNGGAITGPKFFQNNTPDARFFQLSLKYVF
jgi:Carboxypeptidase regulatory-like domain/TonB-dependent Receptor Plug Domain